MFSLLGLGKRADDIFLGEATKNMPWTQARLAAAWCVSGHIARGALFDPFLRNVRQWEAEAVAIGECVCCGSTISTRVPGHIERMDAEYETATHHQT